MAKIPQSLRDPKTLYTLHGVKMSLRMARLYTFLQERGMKIVNTTTAKKHYNGLKEALEVLKKHYEEVKAYPKEFNFKVGVQEPVDMLADVIKDVETLIHRCEQN
jgi:hypothetical protein